MSRRWPLPAAVLLAAALGLGAGATPETGERPVTPVPRVDLERYVGLWHEIAKIPNRFQKRCASGTTAEYALRADGRLTVINRCLRADGRPDEAAGVARSVDPVGNARLEVSFVSFLGWRPFWGDYWVIGLDPDYAWAVVGTPDRKYGWILARTPTLAPPALAAAIAALRDNGYRWEDFTPSRP